jgi:hypothetical protein
LGSVLVDVLGDGAVLVVVVGWHGMAPVTPAAVRST